MANTSRNSLAAGSKSVAAPASNKRKAADPSTSDLNKRLNNRDAHLDKSNLNKTAANNQTDRLPVVRLAINPKAAALFGSNPLKLQTEIARHKGDNLKIKFAYVKRSLVYIATDDKPTYETLTAPWPSGAFESQTKVLSNSPKLPSLLIKGLDRDLDLESPEVLSFLQNQGVTKIERILKHNNEPSTIARLYMDSQDNINKALNDGIRLAHSRLRPTIEIRILQCYRCQQLGHTPAGCKADERCMKCASRQHKTSECSTTSYKCTNCGGDHASCSRACPAMKERERQLSSKLTSNPVTSQNQRKQTYATALSAPISLKEAELSSKIAEMVQQAIQAQLEQLVNMITNQVVQQVSKALEKIIQPQQPTLPKINIVPMQLQHIIRPVNPNFSKIQHMDTSDGTHIDPSAMAASILATNFPTTATVPTPTVDQ